jgi:predicted transcriptional regulator
MKGAAAGSTPVQTKMVLSSEELGKLSALFDAFSQKTRLAILLGFYHGDTAPTIADRLDISRPGLQNHLVKMRNADLLRKTDSGSYELTPVGIHFAELVEEQQHELLDVVNALNEAESEAEQTLSEQVNPDMVSNDEWQRIVEAKKWEIAMEQVDEQLPDY